MAIVHASVFAIYRTHPQMHSLPADRGESHIGQVGSFVKNKFATDPEGVFTLRLSNIVAGSRYRIEVAGTGALAEPSANAQGVASADPVDITLNYYASGNSNNSLRIKVRKASSGALYKDFETQATAQAGTVTSYISQVSDE